MITAARGERHQRGQCCAERDEPRASWSNTARRNEDGHANVPSCVSPRPNAPRARRSLHGGSTLRVRGTLRAARRARSQHLERGRHRRSEDAHRFRSHPDDNHHNRPCRGGNRSSSASRCDTLPHALLVQRLRTGKSASIGVALARTAMMQRLRPGVRRAKLRRFAMVPVDSSRGAPGCARAATAPPVDSRSPRFWRHIRRGRKRDAGIPAAPQHRGRYGPRNAEACGAPRRRPSCDIRPRQLPQAPTCPPLHARVTRIANPPRRTCDNMPHHQDSSLSAHSSCRRPRGSTLALFHSIHSRSP